MEQRQRLYFIQQKKIIECLPHFEKMALSQFKVYIEVETMTHFMCAIIVKRVFPFDLLKIKKGFCILLMLRIHTGLQKWNKNNVYDKHLR